MVIGQVHGGIYNANQGDSNSNEHIETGLVGRSDDSTRGFGEILMALQAIVIIY